MKTVEQYEPLQSSLSKGVNHSIDPEKCEDEPEALLEAGSVYQLFSSRVRKLASA